MEELRRRIEARVHDLVGFGSGEVDLARAPGDPGLFGPGSAAWRVHGDFTTMMIGGIAALLLQMLHPGALAGVWDHSNFRRDPTGRLRRTAQFISATTYGGTAEAERLIARVRAIHDRVAGTLPDGTAYSANDPDLLNWVHVAETTSFLTAFLRYKEPDYPAAEQDRYHDEMATVAERLGATDVPRSRSAAAAFLRDVRPRLQADARTREVAGVLLAAPAPSASMAPVGQVLLQAGIDTMPAWARDMHGLGVVPAARPLVRAGAAGVGSLMRWALQSGSAKKAAAQGH